MPTDPSALRPAGSSFHRRNVTLFALLCVAAAAGVVGYALYSRSHSGQKGAASGNPAASGGKGLDAVRLQPHLLFRNTALGPSYGRVMVAALDAADGPRYATPLEADRVYSAGEVGIGLQASRGVLTTYRAVKFDHNFQVVHTFNLAGVPSRTRVSRDGRRAAVTVFVAGDSYSAAGFSTRTTIYDLGTTTLVGDLEEFAVRKDGQPFKAVDFNFWGVTFAADGDRFYATLATGGKNLLVEGQVSLREMTVLREGVECPSLSPDGTRLAFKSRTMEGMRLLWRLHVLDLRTQRENAVNEPNSVDDQAEWLDEEQVMYVLPRGVAGSGSSDVWVSRADGSGAPRLFVHDATSPCVVRPRHGAGQN